MAMITVIGRGHSGTRLISKTLTESGLFMGKPLARSGDLLPPEKMYEACRVFARYVRWKGGIEWDWNDLYSIEIPVEFVDLIYGYLHSVMRSPARDKGWKLPETTLVFPWIVRLFPDIKYIYWIRNPRDSILDSHLTDDLSDFRIRCPSTSDVRYRRAISWIYQYNLVQSSPKPANWLEIRYEDFVLNQNETLARLGDFIEIKMAKIPVRRVPIDRWKHDGAVNYYDFFEAAMIKYGYKT